MVIQQRLKVKTKNFKGKIKIFLCYSTLAKNVTDIIFRNRAGRCQVIHSITFAIWLAVF